MTLRNKSIVVIVSVSLGLLVALGLCSHRLLTTSFREIDRQVAHNDTARAVATFVNELTSLNRVATDWSHWDDTYNYVESRDPAYIESNLAGDVLLNLRLNVFAILDPRGNLVCGKAFSLLDEAEVEMPSLFKQPFAPSHALLKPMRIEEGEFGLLILPEGPLMIAAQTILTSARQGPPRGVLIMARFLNDREVARLAELSGLDLNFALFEQDAGSYPAFTEIKAKPDTIVTLHQESAATLVGESILTDLAARPAVRLSVRTPCANAARGSYAVEVLMIEILAASVIFIGLMIWLLEIFVVRRVARLANRVHEIGRRQDATQRLDVRGADEIAVLSREINDMLGALETATATAQAATKAKSEFLANMSHEIRTPMTAIMGYADLLADELRDRPSGETVEIIRRNGKHLLAIINDVLDLARVEAGRLQVERVRCHPARILSEVAALMRVHAEAKGLTLTIEYDSPLPETIQSDPVRIRQILLNLVGNAIKFTESGVLRISTRLLRANTATGTMTHTLEIAVADTGVGMTSEQIAKLFKPFSQVDNSHARRAGGTGLGLVVSQRLAWMLGGEIDVFSTPGRGSNFVVTIDPGNIDNVRLLDRPDHEDEFVTQSTPPAETSLSGRILLAEDGPDNQRLIAHILRKAGTTVTLAENGAQAVATAQEAAAAGRPFDVILMDIQMPIMDGYEATRRLREAGYTGCIIALTAHAMASDRENCLNAGCDDYASKPIDRRRLLQMLGERLRNTSTQVRQQP